MDYAADKALKLLVEPFFGRSFRPGLSIDKDK